MNTGVLGVNPYRLTIDPHASSSMAGKYLESIGFSSFE
jgi:hypothetical protein